jgi:putative hemolysin
MYRNRTMPPWSDAAVTNAPAEGARNAHAAPPRAGSRSAAVARAPLIVQWAQSLADVREAQRLRFRVFADEMGARLDTTLPGHDIDRFDPHCEHLLVREPEEGEVIGTYRVLTPARARVAGGFYSDAEFDLGPLAHLRSRMVELGRSCVDARHRHGGVILSLWSALAAFMEERGLDVMIGCASIPMRDGGHAAANLWRQLAPSHLATPELRVQPRLALPVTALEDAAPVTAPPLIKGYLRLGARLLGPPAWDPDFNTADLPMMFSIGELQARHRRHFLGEAAQA